MARRIVDNGLASQAKAVAQRLCRCVAAFKYIHGEIEAEQYGIESSATAKTNVWKRIVHVSENMSVSSAMGGDQAGCE